ncbi:hypothetical protein C8Q80DRAFT_1091289 [Daedaleopsis nitida]|nr:hypothetical protein C8Q80DRAFT_1091289 [Daedaleopsis nitida]
MQNPSSYYSVPKSDDHVWRDWSQAGSHNFTWSGSSSLTTLGEGSSSMVRRHFRRVPMKDLTQCSAIPISYNLTPPTPSATDSDTSSSSQISMESIPEYDEMPEIPFVSAAINSPDGWMDPDSPPERTTPESSMSFWSGIIGLRPSTSKSSADSGAPVLGHTNERVIAPSRTSRKRSGSVSSIASSRTRPAPAKSILSSSSSVKTRRHKAPSVKFLDMPTIHYEDDNDYYDDHEHEPSSCMSPPPPKKARGLTGFFSFKWLFGPSSSSKTPAKTASPERPSISGPFPLWDSPPQRARGGRNGCGSSAASLRSMRSTGSIRSMRSCSSRLPTPTYWPR